MKKEILYHDVIGVESNKQILTWSLDKNMIKCFKSAYYGKIYESPMIDDDIFGMDCWPMGRNESEQG